MEAIARKSRQGQHRAHRVRIFAAVLRRRLPLISHIRISTEPRSNPAPPQRERSELPGGLRDENHDLCRLLPPNTANGSERGFGDRIGAGYSLSSRLPRLPVARPPEGRTARPQHCP